MKQIGPIKARVCEGCGRPKGCTPIAQRGYWHLRCWQRYKAGALRAKREEQESA